MNELKNKKVLVVDDSPTMRMLLAINIRNLATGITVEVAVNGADALEKLHAKDFDLVFTDMQMPEMDGADLIREIRSGMGKTLPVVIVTTKGEEKDRDFGISLGADCYITKPVNAQEIKGALQRFFFKKEAVYEY